MTPRIYANIKKKPYKIDRMQYCLPLKETQYHDDIDKKNIFLRQFPYII